ncbi:MetQ/NlpA family ABC transporter substrate-binding protein [Facklamia hominis]|uniref:Lipoprotein n=1 Tax=Facklamia hominis TaxID=178214 RepID=A0AAJ1V5F1_9LACT|nr:MetQ/NlpA family ABC transporter substrate-binding protein [Facklamia hominis]EPH07756.1 YaeC family lipoprotein [Facklamia hominis ACS-120-V-Sch10]MDK7186949.1 MetQ/NlpA family ABC transporter substrate-binding protein [Facklamia hominis]WPJ90991.1 MetQ/NlpA family ABC transporter substrate-binding protein [Facklamia hominis]
MKKLFKAIASVSLIASLLTGTIHAQDKSFDGESVKVGVASEYEEDVWKVVQDKAKSEGIDLEIVLFNDYVQPNISLADGSIDLNAFQHVAYLNDWNESNKEDLQAIGFSYVAPLKLYSEKIKSLDELKEGDTVAIPSDVTNGGRALLALQQAGVIEVDESKGVLPTVADITKNDKKIKFQELDASQLANALPDVAAAAINNNFATDAGLSDDQAIYNDAEDISSLPIDYKNVIVARADQKENPLYLHIVELYHSQEVTDKLSEVSKGSDVPAWSEKDDLPLNIAPESEKN